MPNYYDDKEWKEFWGNTMKYLDQVGGLDDIKIITEKYAKKKEELKGVKECVKYNRDKYRAIDGLIRRMDDYVEYLRHGETKKGAGILGKLYGESDAEKVGDVLKRCYGTPVSQVEVAEPRKRIKRPNYDSIALEEVIGRVGTGMTKEDAEISLYEDKRKELNDKLMDGELLQAAEICNYMMAIPKTCEEMQNNYAGIVALRREIANRMENPSYDLEQRLKSLVKAERYEDAALVKEEIKRLKAENIESS